MTTAPAACRRATSGAVAVSMTSRRDSMPSVVRSPATGKHSFTLTGTPASKPVGQASTIAASAAASARRCTTAFSRPCTAS
jgi:hypothetical protein